MIIEAVTLEFDEIGVPSVTTLPNPNAGNDLVFLDGRLVSVPHIKMMEEADKWVYATDAEAYLYMNENQSMDQRVIFDTWARTAGRSYFAPGETPSGQAANWRFDAAQNIFRCTVNSGTPLSILSIARHEEYELAAVLASTASDNDAIGLVIAAEVINSEPYLLVAYRTGGHLHDGHMFAIGYLEPGQTNPQIISSVNTGESSGNWSSSGRTSRMEINRQGDRVRVRATRFNSSQYLPDLTVDLSSDSRLHKFRGAMRYGFYTYSQDDSQYRDVDQPEYGAQAFSLESNRMWENIDGVWTEIGEVNLADYLGSPRSVYNPATGQYYYVYEGMT